MAGPQGRDGARMPRSTRFSVYWEIRFAARSIRSRASLGRAAEFLPSWEGKTSPQLSKRGEEASSRHPGRYWSGPGTGLSDMKHHTPPCTALTSSCRCLQAEKGRFQGSLACFHCTVWGMPKPTLSSFKDTANLY